jgi:spore coat polysaccharide biosynthesis predicted glycosyltransferase SpsG
VCVCVGGGGECVGLTVNELICLCLVVLLIIMFIEQIQNSETFMQNNCEEGSIYHLKEIKPLSNF